MDDAEKLIYLDNAATSFPKPPEVGRAMAGFLASRAVNPGRSGFDLSLEAGDLVDGVRTRLDRLFNNPARNPDRTVFTANATAALNLALNGICREGDHVVSTAVEHNSVLRPLTMLAKAGRITFDLAPCDDHGVVDPDAVTALVTPRTRLVVMTQASNVFGSVQPLSDVGRLCRERGVPFLVDAAQSAGYLPVDMAAIGADLVAFTGHKSLLGPTGIGGLVVGPGVDPEPTLWGGTGVGSANLEHPADYPWRLEAGTLNTVGIAGLGAALAWLDERGMESIATHEAALTDRFLDGCASLAKVRVFGPGPSSAGARVPVVSFILDGQDPEKTGMFLDADWDIAVRTGLQCAPLAHEALGTTPRGTVRASFGPFNTAAHVDRLLEALTVLSR